MSIDNATPADWDTLTALNNLSIRKTPDPVVVVRSFNRIRCFSGIP